MQDVMPFDLYELDSVMSEKVRGKTLQSGITQGISWESREKMVCIQRSITNPVYDLDPWAVRLTVAFPTSSFLESWMQKVYDRDDKPFLAGKLVSTAFFHSNYLIVSVWLSPSDSPEDITANWIAALTEEGYYSRTFDAKVLRFLELTDHCEDGDAEILGWEIVRPLAEFYAKARKLR